MWDRLQSVRKFSMMDFQILWDLIRDDIICVPGVLWDYPFRINKRIFTRDIHHGRYSQQLNSRCFPDKSHYKVIGAPLIMWSKPLPNNTSQSPPPRTLKVKKAFQWCPHLRVSSRLDVRTTNLRNCSLLWKSLLCMEKQPTKKAYYFRCFTH